MAVKFVALPLTVSSEAWKMSLRFTVRRVDERLRVLLISSIREHLAMAESRRMRGEVCPTRLLVATHERRPGHRFGQVETTDVFVRLNFMKLVF